jgi:hypothetical protein
MIQSGLPGGMMGSLMADLKGVQDGINYSLKASNKQELTEDDLLMKLFDEVAYVWPKLGYPPLVTPFSQYVKNVALLNIVQLAKGEERYSMMDETTWDMILGKAGKLPGPLAPEIINLAEKQNREFYTGIPQDAYPDVLDKYRKEMKNNKWDFGENDEELFEFAMHETQYRDYKSGRAKKRFEDEIQKLKSQSSTTKTTIAVKEKQTPNRNSYNKDKVEYPIAMIAFLLYSLNNRLISEEQHVQKNHNVWETIGYWRNLMTINLTYNEEEYPVKINKAKDKEYEFEISGNNYNSKLCFIDKGELDFTVNDKTYLANISKGDEGKTKITINGGNFLGMTF